MVKDPQAAPFTIAIVGGGLAGLTLSIGLTRYGISHKIYESAECFAEIGAGIAMGPNAVWALALIDHRLRERYDRCATYNEREDQRELFFDFRQGMASDKTGATKFGDVISSVNCYNYDKTEKGRSCVHRARFLDEMIQLVPDGIAEFNKRMAHMEQDAEGVRIDFDDGSSAYASAVIACDGIKSLARKIVLGADSHEVAPVFAGEYAYRNLFPRAEADEVLGKEKAGNGSIYCGHGAYIVTYPVDHGKLMNMTAVHRNPDPTWTDGDWIAPASRETMLEDFSGWGDPLKQLLSKTKDSSRWALFDAPDAKTYCNGRMCLIGDAAHASTPNQGAGSGMAYEDAYILSALLGEIKTSDQICKAFEAYDSVRRPRTQRLVATSRTAGALYDFVHEGIGDDLVKVKENVDHRHTWIWEIDLPGEVEKAKRILYSK